MSEAKLRISKEMVAIIACVIAFRIFLDWDYADKIAPYFSYQLLSMNYSLSRYAISFVALFIPFVFIVSIRADLARKIVSMMYLTAFVPLTSLYAMSGFDIAWIVLATTFWLVVSVVCRAKLKFNFLPSRTYFALFTALTGFTLIVVVMVIGAFGISLTLNFSDVYELRAENTFSKIPLGGYVIPWAAAVTLPAIALIGWRSGMRFSRGIAALAVVCEIVLFGLTGHKSFLFSMLVIIALSYMMSSKKFVFVMSFGLAALASGVLIFDVMTSSYLMSSLLMRRVFFVPAQLSTFYYDYFGGNPILLSNSIFAPFFDKPIVDSPSLAIGAKYFGTATNANNGVMSDGFMNFGIIGVLIWATVIGLLVSLAASVARHKDRAISEPLILLSFYSFINSGLFTSLLTHGVLLVILIVIFLPRREQPRQALET